MTERPYMQHESDIGRIRLWVLGHMMRGFFLAAAFVLSIALLIGVIYGVSLLLPAESKQAPSPYSALPVAAATRAA